MGKSTITEAEWAVMEPLWKSAPLSAQEIIRALESSRDWNPQTIKTLLGRLVKKGLLSTEKLSNRFLYSPTVERDEAVKQEMDSFVARVSRGAMLPLLVHSIESTERLSQSEIDALRNLLDRQTREE